MNEEFQKQSVNNVEVAEPQEQTVTPQELSATNSEVADPKPVQDAETNAFYAEQRRKQELEQYRNQANEYQQQLDRAARLAGYQSHDELVKALDEIEKQQERAQYEQAGIDPDLLDQYWEKKKQQDPDFQYAANLKAQFEEQQRLQEEANELFAEFPNLKPEDIKPEVFQLQEQSKQSGRPLSLLDAYLRVNYKSLGQQAEQQAIQKLQTNQVTSPGSLSGGDPSHKASIASMSKEDFQALQERVLRGERVQL